MSYDPEAILWLGFTSKDKAVQERFTNFLKFGLRLVNASPIS